MRIIFVLLLCSLFHGPVQAFNPVKSVIKLPFKVGIFAVKKTSKLAFNVASAPVKMAFSEAKPKPKHGAVGNIASFMIKNAPYKDLAFLAL